MVQPPNRRLATEQHVTDELAQGAAPVGGAGGALSGDYPNPGLNVTAVDTSVAARVNDPTSQTAGALRAAYLPRWKASTAYAAGDIVVNPSGQIVQANTAFTSGASYNASNWTVVAGGGGGATDPEIVRDTIAAALVAGTNVTITPNDAADTITVAAAGPGVLLFTDPRVGGVGDGTTDNTAAFNTALGLLATTGGTLFFPPGVYLINGITNDVPGGVWLVGTGFDYHTPNAPADRPRKHSVIRAGAAMTRLIQLGSGNANSSDSGATGASMRALIVDGNNLATTAVKTVARRNRIMECQVMAGTAQALWVAGQNNVVIGSVLAQENAGDVLLIQGYYDNKIWQNQIRGPGSTGAAVRIVNSSQNDIQHNHIWAGANGTSLAAQGLVVIDANQAGGVYKTLIQNNTIEGVIGPSILLNLLDMGAVIRALSISDNRFYQPSATGMTDAGQAAIQMTNAAAGNGFISTVTVADNIIEGADATHRYKALVAWPTNALADNTRWVIDGNTGTFVAAMQSGAPFNAIQWGFNMIQNGSAVKKTKWSDKATASGDGVTLIFSWPHTLDGTPRSVRVTAGSSGAAAAGGFYVTADATNITVTYNGTAPSAGSNNLTWRWDAEV